MLFRLFAASLLAAACVSSVASGEEQVPDAPELAFGPETVLATVNGVEITLGEVIAARVELPAQYQTLDDDVLLEGLVERLIDQKILVAMGEADNLARRPDLVRRIEHRRRSLLAEAALDAEIDRRLTDERLLTVYEEIYADFEAEPEIRARHILVDSEATALMVLAELEEGADFATMAVQHSIGPSGPRGGGLGYFVYGQMVPEFAEAAFALKVGEVSQPVQTAYGWHLILVEERRMSAKPSFEEVRPLIRAELAKEIRDEVMRDIRDGVTIQRSFDTLPPSLIRDDGLLRQ